MEEFLKEYVYYEISSIMYKYHGDGLENDPKEIEWAEVDMGESGIRANLLGIRLYWLFEGRYEARRTLPRSKYRRLCKRVEGRFRKLMKRYRDV